MPPPTREVERLPRRDPAARTRRAGSRSRQLGRKAAELGTTEGAQRAVDQLTRKFGTKVPLKGVDRVLTNPRSVKAWAGAATRTSIAAGLTYLTGGLGSTIEEALAKVGYKRMAYAAAAMMMVSTLVLVSVLVSAAAAVEQVIKPVSVVASILDHIPGFGPEDGDEAEALREIGTMCAAAPDTAAATLPEPSSGDTETAPPADGAAPVEEPPQQFEPEAVIDPLTGKATPRVRDAMQLIPAGTPVLVAEAWMIYYLSHPADDPTSNWDTFGSEFNSAYTFVEQQRGESVAVRDQNGNRVDITPLEIVMALDPNPTYTPFQLVSSAAIYTLGVEEYLPMTELQSSALKGRMYAACGI